MTSDNTPIDRLPFSNRVVSCLRRMSIKTVGDLRQISDRELLRIPNFGPHSLNEIKEVLSKHKPKLEHEKQFVPGNTSDRAFFAGLAVQGITSNCFYDSALTDKEIAHHAVNIADEMLKKLCQHDWEDQGRVNDGYSRGHGIMAYGYKCTKCGETMDIEKDVT